MTDLIKPLSRTKINYILVALLIIAIGGLLVHYLGPKNVQSGLPEKSIQITNSTGKSFNLSVEIASTPSQQETGLMNRTSLDKNRGMLFIFDAPQEISFWMKDTLIPLDIIYLDSNGVILNVIEADPCKISNCPTFPSNGTIKYAIEVNKHWSTENNIKAGDKVNI